MIRIIVGPLGDPPFALELGASSYVIGRQEGCDIHILNERISRQHLRLTVFSVGVQVEDLGSSNGSFLDGALISAPIPLPANSELVRGDNAVRSRKAQSRAIDLFRSNYEPGNEIARGGMGAVIETEDRNIGRTVALKQLLADDRATESEQFRFLQEARIMGHLEHPNIVPMHELSLDENGLPYCTMKRIQRTNLRDVLNRIKAGEKETLAAYPLHQLLNLFLKVCDAIAFAHSQGIVHRDLEPESIMLGKLWEVLAADWGLSQILPAGPLAFLQQAASEGSREITNDSDEATFKTLEGSIMVTPNYRGTDPAVADLGNQREGHQSTPGNAAAHVGGRWHADSRPDTPQRHLLGALDASRMQATAVVARP